MAIVAENSGHGSEWAAPVAGSLFRQLYLPDTAAVATKAVHAEPVPVDTTAD
jgi:hypothetical protein